MVVYVRMYKQYTYAEILIVFVTLALTCDETSALRGSRENVHIYMLYFSHHVRPRQICGQCSSGYIIFALRNSSRQT